MKSKAPIVFVREYVQRLRSKAFIISTILGPVALFAAIFIPVATTVVVGDESGRVLYVVNEAGLDLDRLKLDGDVRISASQLGEDSLKTLTLSGTIDGYLHLPEGVLTGNVPVRYVSRAGGGLQFRSTLRRSVESLVREARLLAAGAGKQVLDIVESEVAFEGVRLTEEGEGADATGFLSLLGYLMAMVIYVCVFLYGSLVMRSVIEEKTSRIVEIVVSSVRPFDLMLGKVLGVGAVGLTQLLIWSGAILALASAGGLILATFVSTPELTEQVGTQAPVDLGAFGVPEIPIAFLAYFLLFFLGGYLLYASLFAAIGSVVEQESDAQQFMLPVAVPIILSVLLLTSVIEAPDSALSAVASYIPFFSPILMPVRGIVAPLAFWEMPLALVLLFGSFGLTIWLCARIYRVGILMYGKRARLSDIVKWIRFP